MAKVYAKPGNLVRVSRKTIPNLAIVVGYHPHPTAKPGRFVLLRFIKGHRVDPDRGTTSFAYDTRDLEIVS